MQEGQIVEWLVSPGQAVAKGQPLVRIEIDKATMDLEAPEAGTVSQICVPAGTAAEVGALLAVIGPGGAGAGDLAGAEPGEECAPAGPTPAGAPADVEVSPAAKDGAPPEQGAAGAARAEDPPSEAARTGRRRASPLARKLAAENGVDLAGIQGTGPGGAVVVEDVRARLGDTTEPRIPPGAPLPAAAHTPQTRALPLNQMQRSMSRRLSESHQQVVQGTTITDVDMSEVVRLRQRVPAGFTAFVVAAASRAVAEFPLINSTLDGDQALLHEHVDMGVAVATDQGLLVPVVRRAETRSLPALQREITELAERARQQRLEVAELSDPTLTVTNSGALGTLFFAPVVALPQSATLGMGRVEPTPVVRDGQVVIREIMYLCLSYDHRFLDGTVAVRYLQRVRALLEDPLSFLWDPELPPSTDDSLPPSSNQP